MEMRDVYRKRMRGMHPDLIAIIETTAERLPFAIGIPKDGHLRTEAEQRKLVKSGASSIMNSRHRTGHAVDLFAEIDGKDVWTNPHARTIAEMMQAVAQEHGIDLVWGGSWKSHDTPHFELPWKDYPKQDTSWHVAPAVSQVKAVMRKSKKHRASGWAKWGMGVTGGVTAGWPAIKQQITVGQDILATVQTVVATHSLLVVSGVCITSAIIFNWLQMRQKEDYAEGRYTPSEAVE